MPVIICPAIQLPDNAFATAHKKRRLVAARTPTGKDPDAAKLPQWFVSQLPHRPIPTLPCPKMRAAEF
jgi:hypothetical protein